MAKKERKKERKKEKEKPTLIDRSPERSIMDETTRMGRKEKKRGV